MGFGGGLFKSLWSSYALSIHYVQGALLGPANSAQGCPQGAYNLIKENISASLIYEIQSHGTI